METAIEEYIKEVNDLRKAVLAVNARQVQSQKLLSRLRLVAEKYFKEIRPILLRPDQQDEKVGSLDKQMQNLFELSHKKGSKVILKNFLTEIRGILISLNGKIVASISTDSKAPRHNSIDERIIETLTQILPPAALSYEQATIDLIPEKRLSWRGPATDLREALRETLDHLAPDREVQAMSGYKQEPNTNGPTMKQKARFILSKRGASKTRSETSENAIEAIEAAVGTFVRSVYTRSSVSTHTPTDKLEVIRVRNFVRVVFCELLEIQT